MTSRSAPLDDATDTPRTDAESVNLWWDIDAQTMVGLDEGDYVPADFARELERENAALRDALADCVAGWDDIDSRIDYVEVQLDKDQVRFIHRLLGKPEPTFL